MRNISTFSAFTTARMGIYAAQKGLNITGHNITNINTTGFTRQRLDQISLSGSPADRYSSRNMVRVGAGVMITGIQQLRDPYLDIRYRNEQSSVGFSDAKLHGLEELASILDEVGRGADGGGIMEAQFNDLIRQLQNLSGKVGGEEFDTLVRSSASSLVRLLNSYAERLEVVKQNQVAGLEQDVKTINGLLEGIRDLNTAIFKSDVRGDPALELRDQRNLLLDQLSQYMKITVSYESVQIGAGRTVEKMIVEMAGTPEGAADAKSTIPPSDDTSKSRLIDGDYARQLSFDKADPNYNMTLSQMTNAKGNSSSYTPPAGQTNTVIALRDNDIYGAIQATREILTEAGEFTEESVILGKTIPDPDDPSIDKFIPPTDINAATKRGIPYYQQSLDALARKLADTLNGANTGYLVDGQGNYVDKDTGAPLEVGGVKLNQANRDSFLPGTPELNLLESNGKLLGGPLFSINSSSNDTTNITAANISISKDWAAGITRIQNSMVAGTSDTAPNSTEPNSTDSENIVRIIALMKGQHNYTPGDVNPAAYEKDNSFFTGTFQEMLANMSGTLANDFKSTSTLLNTYTISSIEIETNRNSVSGVDLNDEATSLMQYQKSYAAACRLMTTLDEALEKLINGTGIVGR